MDRESTFNAKFPISYFMKTMWATLSSCPPSFVCRCHLTWPFRLVLSPRLALVPDLNVNDVVPELSKQGFQPPVFNLVWLRFALIQNHIVSVQSELWCMVCVRVQRCVVSVRVQSNAKQTKDALSCCRDNAPTAKTFLRQIPSGSSFVWSYDFYCWHMQHHGDSKSGLTSSTPKNQTNKRKRRPDGMHGSTYAIKRGVPPP